MTARILARPAAYGVSVHHDPATACQAADRRGARVLLAPTVGVYLVADPPEATRPRPRWARRVLPRPHPAPAWERRPVATHVPHPHPAHPVHPPPGMTTNLTPVLHPTVLYFLDGGACRCGEHAGAQARYTGRTIAGKRVRVVTQEDRAAFEAEGLPLACETCGRA